MKLLPWAFTYCLILLLGNNFMSLCTFCVLWHFFHLIWQPPCSSLSARVLHAITKTLYHKFPTLLKHMWFLFSVIYKLLASKSESIRVQALKVLGYFLKHLGHKWVNLSFSGGLFMLSYAKKARITSVEIARFPKIQCIRVLMLSKIWGFFVYIFLNFQIQSLLII